MHRQEIYARGSEDPPLEGTQMYSVLLRLYVKLQNLLSRKEGQDLVEYALIVALIAFGAITGMGYLAKGLNNAFSTISTTLAHNV